MLQGNHVPVLLINFCRFERILERQMSGKIGKKSKMSHFSKIGKNLKKNFEDSERKSLNFRALRNSNLEAKHFKTSKVDYLCEHTHNRFYVRELSNDDGSGNLLS